MSYCRTQHHLLSGKKSSERREAFLFLPAYKKPEGRKEKSVQAPGIVSFCWHVCGLQLAWLLRI